MLYKVLITLFLFSCTSFITMAQVKVKKKAKKEVASPVILETQKSMNPELEQELEVIEKAEPEVEVEEEAEPERGEPIIGAEIFEEQQATELDKKKKENKASGKKED